MNELLGTIYKNVGHSAGFSSVRKLYEAAKQQNPLITMKNVQDWLSKQDAYTLHKPTRRKFKRNKIYVSGIDEQWELDLVDMKLLESYNNNFRYMLCCIDVFSKFAWVHPLKTKNASEICNAMRNIFNKGRIPWKIRTDKGTEFVNKNFKALMQENDISFFTSQNEDIKCSIVERFNRTLKSKMWKYFTNYTTYKWIDIIDALVSSYNNSKHRSIGEKPAHVTWNMTDRILKRLYPDSKVFKTPKFAVGDHIRISKYKQVFDKGYIPNYTEEIFLIHKIVVKNTEPFYKIKDLKGELIDGYFYEKEIQKVGALYNDQVFKVERIIKKRRTKNGTMDLLVKWWGYPEKFNEWISETDVE